VLRINKKKVCCSLILLTLVFIAIYTNQLTSLPLLLTVYNFFLFQFSKCIIFNSWLIIFNIKITWKGIKYNYFSSFGSSITVNSDMYLISMYFLKLLWQHNSMKFSRADRCEGSLTFQGLTPSPSSGCCWRFGRLLVLTNHQHPEDGDQVSPWTAGVPSHLDSCRSENTALKHILQSTKLLRKCKVLAFY
jgi:hypothetical protein